MKSVQFIDVTAVKNMKYSCYGAPFSTLVECEYSEGHEGNICQCPGSLHTKARSDIPTVSFRSGTFHRVILRLENVVDGA